MQTLVLNTTPLLRRFAMLAVLLLAAPTASAEDVVVIVNKSNTHAIDADFIVRVYLGTVKGWPDGSSVVLYDQAEDSPAREAFCNNVLRKNVRNVKAIWSQNIFTGKGLPPKILSPDAAVKKAVASQPTAIGYILASQVDDTVRVVGR